MNKQTAKQEVGVWIDHKEAFVVFSHDESAEAESIASDMEKHVRYSGYEAADGLAEDQRDRRFIAHLDQYYDEVIAHLKDATAILIFGPGEAKGEFRKRLEHNSSGGQIVGFETVGKLTNPQMVAKVQAFFHH